MKKSPTLLMKELKAIENEIAEIHNSDGRDSSVPVNTEYTPRYQSTYSYEENRKRVKELQQREAKIRASLNFFNNTTKVEGFDLTVSEALVKIAQLRSEIKALAPMVNHQEVFRIAYSSRFETSGEIHKTCYDIAKVKEDLKSLQQELATLQVAVDKINLISSVDC